MDCTNRRFSLKDLIKVSSANLAPFPLKAGLLVLYRLILIGALSATAITPGFAAPEIEWTPTSVDQTIEDRQGDRRHS